MPDHQASDECLWAYRAKLQRVVDGDTLYVLVDLGMHVHSTQSLRLAGIDTPEIFSGDDRERGFDAKAFTTVWLAEHTHGAGEWPLRIRTEKDRQSFNRYVADVRCTWGHSLSADLRAAGYAT